jgi:hypothetical protein
MEPVVTKEGFKVLQNPEESRTLLGAYYESQGFHVITKENNGHAEKLPSEKPATAEPAGER